MTKVNDLDTRFTSLETQITTQASACNKAVTTTTHVDKKVQLLHTKEQMLSKEINTLKSAPRHTYEPVLNLEQKLRDHRSMIDRINDASAKGFKALEERMESHQAQVDSRIDQLATADSVQSTGLRHLDRRIENLTTSQMVKQMLNQISVLMRDADVQGWKINLERLQGDLASQQSALLSQQSAHSGLVQELNDLKEVYKGMTTERFDEKLQARFNAWAPEAEGRIKNGVISGLDLELNGQLHAKFNAWASQAEDRITKGIISVLDAKYDAKLAAKVDAWAPEAEGRITSTVASGVNAKLLASAQSWAKTAEPHIIDRLRTEVSASVNQQMQGVATAILTNQFNIWRPDAKLRILDKLRKDLNHSIDKRIDTTEESLRSKFDVMRLEVENHLEKQIKQLTEKLNNAQQNLAHNAMSERMDVDVSITDLANMFRELAKRIDNMFRELEKRVDYVDRVEVSMDGEDIILRKGLYKPKSLTKSRKATPSDAGLRGTPKRKSNAMKEPLVSLEDFNREASSFSRNSSSSIVGTEYYSSQTLLEHTHTKHFDYDHRNPIKLPIISSS